ncbi:aminotransferase-like domain-containing protein [Caenimonas soli]|uniref:aminotransferase-like domain-containing protein n=1 Tax=Caenimonas soli TaxID=2735555 RepID=UPI001552E42A|nr:PLP-dependent aminotransferase family protein [Caenimonas soli]NPC58336.1 PLP-dependent aminotransferase family protein [Caenimonas soli]
MISFAGGYPSPALFDAEGLSQAAERVFAEPAKALQYGPTEGSAPLRQALLRLSRDRGVACSADELLVTTGSQQAFDLLVRTLVQPGDVVLLEAPAYPAAIQALRLAGAVIHEVPMDAEGLRTELIEDTLKGLPPGAKPKLLYTVPTFSNPRGTLLPHARRVALIEVARRHGFLIVEDDPYGELTFTGATPQPLYALAQNEPGAENPVVYLSSLSKTVAPALRIGWMVASAEIVRRCVVAKQTVDLCTSPIAQLIACEYLQSGRYPGTVTKARDEYKARAEAMADTLDATLGARVRFERAQGGMFLWMECTAPVDPQRLFTTAVEEGVLFVPGAAFYSRVAKGVSMRLSFAAPDVSQIREGVARLSRAFDSSTSNIPALS